MSENHPRVSVVIATYNRPAFLRCAIASVVRGSYENFEIIVTDDAGSKENRQVVESFGDPRLRYRRSAVRLGSAGNHREGLKIATGEYIRLLNDDDEWDKELLTRLVPIIDENSNVVVAFSDHWVIDAEGDIDAGASDQATRRFKRDKLSAGLHQPFYRIALVDQSVPMVAALLRRDAIEWNDSPQETSSLYDFWVTYLAARTDMGAWYVPERLARYRVHGTNETAIAGERVIRPAIYIYTRLIADPNFAQLRPEFAKRLQQAQRSYGIFLLRKGYAGQSREYLKAAMPDRRAAAALALSYAPKAVRSLALAALGVH